MNHTIAILDLQRVTKNQSRTLGILYLNGDEFCYTLEDVDRGLRSDMDLSTILALKQYGRTAIPKGTYEVVIRRSPRFKRDLPALNGVRGFEGILIHSGNTEFDTSGCILVGDYYEGNEIRDSRETLKKLIEKLSYFDEISINITEV
jgi:hypothetical protein